MLNNISRTLLIHAHMPPVTGSRHSPLLPMSSIIGLGPPWTASFPTPFSTAPLWTTTSCVFSDVCAIPTYPPLPHTSLLRALQLAFFWVFFIS
jgi:hypothetical protein